jgi:hypothetical protein
MVSYKIKFDTDWIEVDIEDHANKVEFLDWQDCRRFGLMFFVDTFYYKDEENIGLDNSTIHLC